MTAPHFLIVGNGSYENRGCEAIVRGTMAILRREFGEEFRVILGTFATPDVVADQAAKETDSSITHVALKRPAYPRWSLPWWRRKLLPRRAPAILDDTFSMLDRFRAGASCAMQIGGDNYSLDYGRPRMFMSLDNYLNRYGVPIVLWGASVGPFETDPEFAPEMYAHLRTLRAIFVRESDSYDYLKRHGIDAHLHRMSDPAFVMDPFEPPADKLGCPIPPGAIGLNLSPLMARYTTAGDMEAWCRLSVDILHGIVEATRRDVLLIPHETRAWTDDHEFLRRVANACPKVPAGEVFCLDDKLSAAETKWVISRCAVFAGARTHSTIAAISSGVPTLSLSYSRKAQGLNHDIFGSQDYCLPPSEISPAVIAERIGDLLAKRDAIVNHLACTLPQIRESTLRSGAILRRLIEMQ